MLDFWWNLWSEFDAMSAWELLATLLLIIYVVLAAKGTRWCWPPGIIGSAITMVLVYKSNYFLESGLQFYYVIMGIYGWIFWTNNSSDSGETEIKKLTAKEHLLNELLSPIQISGNGDDDVNKHECCEKAESFVSIKKDSRYINNDPV